MGQTKIEWTAQILADGTILPGYTFNSWWGCIKIADGCKFCYAQVLDRRWNGDHWGPEGKRKFFSDKHWNDPHKWNKKAAVLGYRIRVFCASMADVFEDLEVLTPHRERLFKLIEDTPNLQWMLLTKRPHNIERFMPDRWWSGRVPENVEFGYSVCTQHDLDTGWPLMESLKAIHKVTTFMSMEPLLGPVDITSWLKEIDLGDEDHHKWSAPPDFIIAGGESGHGARPMHPEWVDKIRIACVDNHVLFFFKQWGEYIPYSQTSEIQQDIIRSIKNPTMKVTNYQTYYKLGKHVSGRKLNGIEYNNLPGPFPILP